MAHKARHKKRPPSLKAMAGEAHFREPLADFVAVARY